MSDEAAVRVVEVRASWCGTLLASRRLGAPPVDTPRWFRLGVGLVLVGVLLAVAEIVAAATRVRMPLDGAAIGLGLLVVGFGIASAAWHRGAEGDATRFRVGEDPSADVTARVPDLAGAHLDLVVRHGAGIRLQLTPAMTGWIGTADAPVTFDELADAGGVTDDDAGRRLVDLPADHEAEIVCGDLTVHVSDAGGLEATPRARLVDLRLLAATTLAALLVGGTIVLAMHFVPDADELPDQEDRPVVYPR